MGSARKRQDGHPRLRRPVLYADADRLWADHEHCRFSNYNVDVFTAYRPISYPAPNPPLVPSIQNVTIFPTHPDDPVSTNWMLGIQQQVFKDSVLTVDYVGNKVTHMQAGVSFAAINLNPSNPADARADVFRPSHRLSIRQRKRRADSLSSTYNALQVQVRSNIGKKLNLQVNYTWSHEIDDLVNVFSGWSDPFNINLDRSSGDWDVRHNLTASAVYSLAELKDSNALERGVLGGWQLSSIVQARSGLPTNIQLVSGFFGNPMRPDFTGQPVTTSGPSWPYGNYNSGGFEVPPGWNGNWGDPSTIGSVGRNALRGPGVLSMGLLADEEFRDHGKNKPPVPNGFLQHS